MVKITISDETGDWRWLKGVKLLLWQCTYFHIFLKLISWNPTIYAPTHSGWTSMLTNRKSSHYECFLISLFFKRLSQDFSKILISTNWCCYPSNNVFLCTSTSLIRLSCLSVHLSFVRPSFVRSSVTIFFFVKSPWNHPWLLGLTLRAEVK